MISSRPISFLFYFLIAQSFYVNNLKSQILNYKTDSHNRDSTIYFTKLIYQLTEYQNNYQAIKKNGGFIKIENSNTHIKVGDTSAKIIEYKKYFLQTRDLINHNQNNVYDSALFYAIQSFQKRTGLKQDGLISKFLIKKMNVSIDERLNEIEWNISKLKLYANKAGKDFVIINIPTFSLYAFENDKLQFTMKVIVGKKNKQTKIFNSEILKVVFCPYWNIPNDIFYNEIIPIVKRNPKYLYLHHIDFVNGLYRQQPGNDNPLGKIKFIFPNNYNIYMHDTPNKNLFKFQERTFSHGCIRVENAYKLAKYILQKENNWNEKLVDSMLLENKEKAIDLKQKLTIYITYFTTWVNEENQLLFANDVYNLKQ